MVRCVRNLEENNLETENNESAEKVEPCSSTGILKQEDFENHLKKEWKELAANETKNWFNVIIGICQILVSEYSSLRDTEDKVESWCEMARMLADFREAEINENDIIFEKFLDYLKKKKLENPEDINDEDEKIWKEIKQLKIEKDNEWKKYHVGTWKYWYQKEFPSLNHDNRK
ncbi:ring-exported protein 3, putative [Plasmodium ovale curtisi]|uniref:Ring-exported protein 3, putative n=1 Tax=Plasmodium ovale curtisi TaxID=864141 RepID=A0A1A8X422_PLAOA|nr:ring-exported protein 3, putative [Plasmodium ovale curtisi]SBS98919.1 ring-exported protein 3, putative [Plasmodium ovale curtisi]